MSKPDYQAFWVFNFREFAGVDARHEIERQLGDFADRGMSRVVVHLRFGHQVPYLSETWAGLLRHMLQVARARGLRLVLWEDDAWPPGFVGGRLTLERPELRGHNMRLCRRTVPAGSVARWELGGYPILAIRACAASGAEVDLWSHIGTHATQWSVFPCQHLYVGGDRNADQVVYSRANQGDIRYVLDWTPPTGSGEWTVYWLERVEADFKYNGYLLDGLSREATQARLAWNYDWYGARFAEHFGSTIAGFYCAEPPINNWTPDLFVRFQQRFGYRLEEEFPRLGYREDARSAQVRLDYKRLVSDLFADHYIAPARQWCASRGLEFWARLEGDDSVRTQSEHRGGIYPAVRLFTTPVFDLVNGTQFGDPTHRNLGVGINFCNSVARQNGGPTLFEGVGPVNWSMKLADADAQFNWAIVMGSTSLQCENLFYSIDGHRKEDCPPSRSYQNPHWRIFGAWRDQFERLAAALGAAEPIAAETALLVPISSMNACRPALPLQEESAPGEREVLIEEAYQDLHQRALDEHVALDLLDERALEEATVTGATMIVGRQRYKVLVLPYVTHLSPEAQRRLASFSSAGGTLYHHPQTPPHLVAALGGRALAPGDLMAQLRPESTAGLPAGCYSRAFQDGDTRLWLLFNATTKPLPSDELPRHFTRVVLDRTAVEQERLEPGALSLWREGSSRTALLLRDDQALELPASAWAVEMPLNALVLDTWNIKVMGPGRLDTDTVAPASFGSAVCKAAPLFQQVELRGHEHRRYQAGHVLPPDGNRPVVAASPFPLRVAYRSHFIPDAAVLDSLQLVVETEGILGAWRMLINGRPVPPDAFAAARVYDVGNRALALAPFLRAGAPNWIEVQVQADQPTQGLVEPVRIFGHFVLERHPNGPRLLAPDRTVGLGDWSGYGYPETCGWATYRTSFVSPGKPGDAPAALLLDLGMVHEVCSVYVDEHLVAHRFKGPYAVRLDGLAPATRHTLRVEVANGLGNLLQRLRNPGGLYGPVRIWPLRSSAH